MQSTISSEARSDENLRFLVNKLNYFTKKTGFCLLDTPNPRIPGKRTMSLFSGCWFRIVNEKWATEFLEGYDVRTKEFEMANPARNRNDCDARWSYDWLDPNHHFWCELDFAERRFNHVCFRIILVFVYHKYKIIL